MSMLFPVIFTLVLFGAGYLLSKNNPNSFWYQRPIHIQAIAFIAVLLLTSGIRSCMNPSRVKHNKQRDEAIQKFNQESDKLLEELKKLKKLRENQ